MAKAPAVHVNPAASPPQAGNSVRGKSASRGSDKIAVAKERSGPRFGDILARVVKNRKKNTGIVLAPKVDRSAGETKKTGKRSGFDRRVTVSVKGKAATSRGFGFLLEKGGAAATANGRTDSKAAPDSPVAEGSAGELLAAASENSLTRERRDSEIRDLPVEIATARNKEGAGRITDIEAPLVSRSGKVEVVDFRQRRSLRNGDTTAKPVTLDNNAARFSVVDTELDLNSREVKALTGRNGNTAAETLANRLRGESGADIVRQVRVLMNRGDAGEIRMDLKPPELGRVRIRLRMDENRLVGRILVESGVAREAFRASQDSLVQRLQESGFDSARLDVALDGSRHDGRDGDFRENGEGADQRSVARNFDEQVPTSGPAGFVDNRINLMV